MPRQDRENEVNFDFYGQEAERKRQQEITQNNLQHEKFLKLGKNALAALGVAAVLFGGSYAAYSMYQKNIDNKLATAEATIKSIPKMDLINFMQKEKTVLQKTYNNNQMLLNDHGQYKQVIEVLNVKDQLGRFSANNSRLYKESLTNLDKDTKNVVAIYDNLNSTRDAKINLYLDGGADLQKLTAWNNAYKNKQFMYAGGLINLQKDLNKNLDMLKQTQDDIIDHVKQRVKNKDFDLNAAQSQFIVGVSNDANKEINEIKQVRKDLVEMNDLAAEDSDGNMVVANPMLQNMLTDSDIKEAETSMTTYKDEALSQIGKDRANVEQLLGKVNEGGTQTNAAPTAATQPNTVVVHSGPSFLDYYLMYHWMSMGSNSSYRNSAVTNSSLNNTTKMASTYKPLPPIVQNNNPYDLRNQNSHLNRTLAQAPTANATNRGFAQNMSKVNNFKSPRPDIASIRSKIEAVKSKASQANSARTSEFNRMKAVNTYQGSGTGAKGLANKSSVAKSVSSRASSRSSGFGGRSGGFGG